MTQEQAQEQQAAQAQEADLAETAGRKSSHWPLVAGLVLVTVAAYWQSFSGAFVFDDPGSIRDNPTIRSLWPLSGPLSPPRGQGITVEGRPIVNLSLAINWAISGDRATFSYHVVNLAVHLLAALALFGLVRRTLLLPKWRGRFDSCAAELAMAAAAIWTLHPMQTESVTYIVQRAESLMGMFYLLTLYCSLRAGTDRPRGLWIVLATAACALGMGSKEVMVSAPLAVLLFDRAFLFDGFLEALRRRWKLYALLAATWAILAFEVSQSATRGGTAGFTDNIKAWDYIQTQMMFITHYLRVVFWPDQLVLDYGFQLTTGWASIWPYALFIAVLLAATIVALWYRSWVGYLAVLFWMLLAPTSSFVPNVNQTGAEHRMYMALAPLAVLAVMAAYLLYQRIFAGRTLDEDGRWLVDRVLPSVALLAVLGGLGTRTWYRNIDYHHEATLWWKVVTAWPGNPRGWENISYMYSNWGEQFAAKAEAESDYRASEELRKRSVDAYEKALAATDEAVRRAPKWSPAYADRAGHYEKLKRPAEALADYDKAIELDDKNWSAYCNRGSMRFAAGNKLDAMKDFDRAIEVRPGFVPARVNRAGLLMENGNLPAAKLECEEILRLYPENTVALEYLAETLRRQKQLEPALGYINKALELDEKSAHGYIDRARILADMNRIADARQDVRRARELRMLPPPELEAKLR